MIFVARKPRILPRSLSSTGWTNVRAMKFRHQSKDLCALGPVDKVDFQIGFAVIQDCFLGGGFGTWGFVGRRVAAHWRALAS